MKNWLLAIWRVFDFPIYSLLSLVAMGLIFTNDILSSILIIFILLTLFFMIGKLVFVLVKKEHEKITRGDNIIDDDWMRELKELSDKQNNEK